jgi:hypothetical protein
LGGFLASVLLIGVVHPPGINVSAEDTDLGGAEGSFFALGGATNPFSLDPSPANTVPAHKVIATNTVHFLFIIYPS